MTKTSQVPHTSHVRDVPTRTTSTPTSPTPPPALHLVPLWLPPFHEDRNPQPHQELMVVRWVPAKELEWSSGQSQRGTRLYPLGIHKNKAKEFRRPPQPPYSDMPGTFQAPGMSIALCERLPRNRKRRLHEKHVPKLAAIMSLSNHEMTCST
ncbi:unnamed protein product [Allacma fusca]|uniref:Uncharacterized protein n=1 Tax=Allacma fusca TaxID=39272 RepID=A0A8J2KU86_9HEXA|nr:unnamed protein product [Allacma fusca]